ncbi:N-acetylmuramoyl-L-alanine amidase family protein [Yeosuana marina]|uniref:N-acetylmuramoyl-L-alanine amidase family protein n=1 Tax=Yeosuana marina TaxID=1565536 RepID=UPI00141EDD1A|nr:N-acetylmuramoyl-L-alanine amidase [Yeosuana marina]
MKTHRVLLFVSFIIVLTCSPLLMANNIKLSHKFVVVLDAGHGGKDPGRPTKNGYKEKDIALKIVLAIGAELEKNPDIKVIYTRKTDVFVDLFERGRIANKAEADLFVSIHCNAHNTQAEGAETYVLGIHRNKTNFEVAKAENEAIYFEEDYEKKYSDFNPNSPEAVIGLTLAQEEYLDQSIELATHIQKNFVKELHRKDRGVKQAGFIVLHQTVMPSVLVETGFITNRTEGAFLNSKRGQQEIAKSIAEAIVNYKNSLNQNVGEDMVAAEATNKQEVNQPTSSDNDIIFKVQIAAGSRKIATKPYNFKTLDDISREQEGGLYKYYYGSTPDFNKVQKLEEIAKTKGYKSSFIVAFKDGKKISLDDALKTSAN